MLNERFEHIIIIIITKYYHDYLYTYRSLNTGPIYYLFGRYSSKRCYDNILFWWLRGFAQTTPFCCHIAAHWLLCLLCLSFSCLCAILSRIWYWGRCYGVRGAPRLSSPRAGRASSVNLTRFLRKFHGRKDLRRGVPKNAKLWSATSYRCHRADQAYSPDTCVGVWKSVGVAGSTVVKTIT